MSRAGFARIVLAVLAPSLLAPALAGAQLSQGIGISLFGAGNPKLVSIQEIPVRFSGQLTVAFHGDAASGCVSRGVCGYSGSVSWRAPASGSLEILRSRVYGHIEESVQLGPGNANEPVGGVATAKVELSAPAGTSRCLDANATGDTLTLPIRRGRVAFALGDASPSLLTTRCAGPLESDIAPELPVPTLPLGSVLHGRTTVGLGASGSFASHGFAGTVASSLSVSLGKPGRTRPASSGTGAIPTARYRQLAVTYRATLRGSVVAQVLGDSDPAVCAALGSCGLAGMLTLRPGPARVNAAMYFTAPVRRPPRDLLAAAGLSRSGRAKGVQGLGSVNLSRGGEVTAAIDEAGTTCTDATPLRGGTIILASAKGRVGASFLPLLGGGIRTRCPGPEADSAVPLAGGAIPLDHLRGRTVTLDLTFGSSFLDYGYDIRSVAHLTLTLTRVGTRTRVITEPAGFF
jgi:hypothetical protein